VRTNRARCLVAVCLSILAGCATDAQVHVAIPAGDAASQTSSVAQAEKGLRVVVSPFEDARSDRTHVGNRSHLLGATSYFDLPKGTAGEAVAKAFVRQLNKRGWQASLAGQGGIAQPDATISGTIQDLSVNANSRFGHTEIAAKNTMMVRVANHSDDSTIQERVLGNGIDDVFWFDPEDAQQLVNAVLEKNIERFLSDTKVDGRAVRLR
jgi:hypothetical protein